jgi:hypothetical protein
MPSSDLDDLIARAAEDRPFRRNLVRNPEAAAKAAGYRLTKWDVEILRVMAEEGEEAFFGEADAGIARPGTMVPVDEFLRTGGTGGMVETAEDEEVSPEEEPEEEEEEVDVAPEVPEEEEA